MPEPVINGFTIGIAVIIATSQLADLFGLSSGNVPAEFVGKLEALWAARRVQRARFGIALRR